jgi:hypothetical protein
MRVGCVALLSVILGCGGPDAVAPPITSPPQPVSPQPVPPGVSGRLIIVATPTIAVPGATLDLRARVLDAVNRIVPHQRVRWSAVPASAVRFTPLFADSSELTRITVVHPGTVQISASADSLVATLTLDIVPAPPETGALVVERFVMQKFPDGPDRDYYMPQVTLRESSGTQSVELVGVSVSVPTAPALSMCSTSRIWTPGMRADAFGLSYGDPDLGFGPFNEADFPLGPVTVVLILRHADGSLGSIYLSRVMTTNDIVTGAPEQRWSQSIACPS